MPDPFKIELQARPFPVPERVEVEIDGLETKWVPLSAVLEGEPLAAQLGERSFKGDGFFGFVAVHLPAMPIPAPRESFTLRWSL